MGSRKRKEGKRGTYQVREGCYIRARDRPESLRTFIQGQCGRRVDFRGTQLTRESCVGSDGHRSAVSFAAFVEDGDGGNVGAGGVCWDGLAGAVRKEGDAIGADETSLRLLSVGGTGQSSAGICWCGGKKGLQVRPGRRPVVISYGVEVQITDIYAVCNHDRVVLHVFLIVEICFGAAHDRSKIHVNLLAFILRRWIEVVPMCIDLVAKIPTGYEKRGVGEKEELTSNPPHHKSACSLSTHTYANPPPNPTVHPS